MKDEYRLSTLNQFKEWVNLVDSEYKKGNLTKVNYEACLYIISLMLDKYEKEHPYE